MTTSTVLDQDCSCYSLLFNALYNFLPVWFHWACICEAVAVVVVVVDYSHLLLLSQQQQQWYPAVALPFVTLKWPTLIV